MLFKTYLFITQYKNKKKIKTLAPTWNDEFELLDGSYSMSDIQCYIEYIIKKHETLRTISPIHVYISRINNRLVFKIKDRYKLQLQTPETMKLFSSTRSLEVVGVVSVHFNLVNDQYQQKSKILYLFTRNKSYAYFLNVEPSIPVYLKAYNTEFDEIITTFTDPNGRLLEIEDKINLKLLINK